MLFSLICIESTVWAIFTGGTVDGGNIENSFWSKVGEKFINFKVKKHRRRLFPNQLLSHI